MKFEKKEIKFKKEKSIGEMADEKRKSIQEISSNKQNSIEVSNSINNAMLLFQVIENNNLDTNEALQNYEKDYQAGYWRHHADHNL
jgi:hypothetical protein